MATLHNHLVFVCKIQLATYNAILEIRRQPLTHSFTGYPYLISRENISSLAYRCIIRSRSADLLIIRSPPNQTRSKKK